MCIHTLNPVREPYRTVRCRRVPTRICGGERRAAVRDSRQRNYRPRSGTSSRRAFCPSASRRRGESGDGRHSSDVGRSMRRIVLIDLPWCRPGDELSSLGHVSLLASLRCENDIEVVPVSRPVNDARFSVDALVRDTLVVLGDAPPEHADVAIGIYVWNDTVVSTLIRRLRRSGFAGRIILGGPQITYAAPGVDAQYPGADAFVRGQGEFALRQLAIAGGRPRIPGVHYAGEEDLAQQAPSPFLDAPSPWLLDSPALDGESRISWETQRGCPFRCTFCQHRQPDRKVPVPASCDRIDAEIDLFCHAGVRRISVIDPVFNLHQDHALHVLTRIGARDFTGELSLQCRAELVTPAFLDAVQALDVSLEFGVQSIHPKEFLAVGRPNHMAKVEAVLREVARRGIRYEVSMIYGLPEQTPASFASSLGWCEDLKVPVIRAYPLLLLRGTPLALSRETWGLEVAPGDLPIVIRSRSFTYEDWQAMDRRAADTNARAEPDAEPPIGNVATLAARRSELVSASLAALGKA